jgi:hypothetical protein
MLYINNTKYSKMLSNIEKKLNEYSIEYATGNWEWDNFVIYNWQYMSVLYFKNKILLWLLEQKKNTKTIS